MRHRAWLRASVLAAAVASVSVACSSTDSSGSGSGGAGTSSTAGGSKSSGGASSGAGTSNTAAGSLNQSGSATGGSSQSGAASSSGGSNSGAGSNSGGNSNAGSNSAGTSSGGSANNGAPTAAELLAKLGSCTKIHGPFNPDEPGSGNIDVCQTGSAMWWKADLDVDCDGIQTPPCNTDNTGQPQTSIDGVGPSGDVDPTKLPYFVIPLGTPETEWYTPYGVELGQIGAVIYKGQVIYGIFADQAGGNFIGEASYKMCSLFIGAGNCDPNMGGIDPLDVTYITFSGTTPRAAPKDIYDHDKHTALGEAAAKAWLAE